MEKIFLLFTIIIFLTAFSFGAELSPTGEEVGFIDMLMSELGEVGFYLTILGIISFTYLGITIIPYEIEANKIKEEELEKLVEDMHRNGWGR